MTLTSGVDVDVDKDSRAFASDLPSITDGPRRDSDVCNKGFCDGI
jgi:hypothetical protein